MISMQNGYSTKKITIMAVFFVFASIIMWMLNHKNRIGQNKFKMTKVAMIVTFAILVIIPAIKAGVHINVAFEKDSTNIGALVIEHTGLKITATADGKGNAIRKLNYVWSDSFTYDKGAIVTSDKTKILLKIESNHLIIWAEDRYGIVTRKDCWFYDVARSDYNSKDIYRIGINKE